MKAKFITVQIAGKCFDLPKDINIPSKGDTIFVNDYSGEVFNTHYHIINNKVHSVTIFTHEIK